MYWGKTRTHARTHARTRARARARARARTDNPFSPLALSLALSGFRFSSSIFAKLHPHHSLPPEEIIRQFSACGSAWSNSKVRAIDWHPHTLKLVRELEGGTFK